MFSNENMSVGIGNEAMKLIQKGRHEEAIRLIKNSKIQDKIGEEDKAKILKAISEESAKIKVSRQMKKDKDKTTSDIAEKLNALGLNIDSKTLKRLTKKDKEANKLFDLISGEISIRDKQREKVESNSEVAPENTISQLNEEQAKRHEEIYTEIKKATELLSELVNGNTNKNKKRKKKQQERYDEVANITSDYDYIDNSIGADVELDEDDEFEVAPERVTLGEVGRHAKRITKRALRGVRSLSWKGIKGTYKEGRGILSALRRTRPANYVLGDKNEDWHDGSKKERTTHESKILKTISGFLAAIATKQDIDPEKIDTDGSQKSMLSRIKSRFKNSFVYHHINGKIKKFVKTEDGNLEEVKSNSQNDAVNEELEEQKETQRGILSTLRKIPFALGNLFGIHSDEKDSEDESWFSKILGKAKKGLTIGASIAAGFGFLGWAKDTIFPAMKMYWTDSVVPYLSDAWQGKKSGFGSFIYSLNPQNPDGLISRFKNFVSNDLPGILKTVATYVSDGVNWALTNVLPAVISTAIANAPTILASLAEGILGGLDQLFFGKKESKFTKMSNFGITDGGASTAISSMQSKSTPTWFDSKVPITNELAGYSSNTTGTSSTLNQNMLTSEDITSMKNGLTGLDPEERQAAVKRGKISKAKDIIYGIKDIIAEDDPNVKKEKINSYRSLLLGNNYTSTQDKKSNGYGYRRSQNGYSNTSLPLAFNEINPGYIEKAKSEYEKVKDNTIETQYGTLTVKEILNDDRPYFYSEDNIPLYGYQLLNYNDTAEWLGMNIHLNSDEARANTKRAGGNGRRTLLNQVSKASGKSFIYGLAGDGTGAKVASSVLKGGSNVIGKPFSKIGSVLKHIPGVKTIGKLSGLTGTVISKGGKAVSSLIETANKAGLKLAGHSTEPLFKSSGKIGNFIKNFGKQAVEPDLNDIDDATELLMRLQNGETIEGGSKLITKLKNSKVGKFVSNTLDEAGILGKKYLPKVTEAGAKAFNQITTTGAKVLDNVKGSKVYDSVKGVASKVGKTAKNSKLAKFITKSGSAFSGFLKDKKVFSYITKCFSKSGKKLTKNAIKEGIEKFAKTIAKGIAKYLKKFGAKLTAKVTIKIGAYVISVSTLMIADAVISFISGFSKNKSKSILGITEEPTLPQRLITGLINAICEVFTLGLVPASFIVDLVVDNIHLLGIDAFGDLKELRAQAQKEVDEYNAENGTDFSVEDYVRKDSWWNKTKRSVGNWWSGVKKTVGGWFGKGSSDEDEDNENTKVVRNDIINKIKE